VLFFTPYYLLGWLVIFGALVWIAVFSSAEMTKRFKRAPVERAAATKPPRNLDVTGVDAGTATLDNCPSGSAPIDPRRSRCKYCSVTLATLVVR
jgi:hypothetical protein